MYLIVGLGNPGEKYAKTRHNAGFMVLDLIAQESAVQIKRAKFRALTAKARWQDTEVILAKPQTFMNLSGESVAQLANFYKIPPENIIVIYDDIYVNFGEIRIRQKGSSGGHNGMKNIIQCLGTEIFPRIRIGVGPQPENTDLYEYVLENFTDTELAKFKEIYQKITNAKDVYLV